MTQNELSARKTLTFRHLATVLLAGLLWFALTTLAQAAGGGALIKAETATPRVAAGAAANGGSGVLLYNPSDGAATYGTVYADGHFLTTAYYPPGSFATGWSHIVRANGLLFFFRQTDGFWATVRANSTGDMNTLHQGYTGFYVRPGYSDYMHVVSTPNGILICCGSSNRFYDGPWGGIVGQVQSNGSFWVTHAASFAAWAKVVNTPNGLFFWKAQVGTGIVAVGRIQPNGVFVQTYSTTLAGTWLEHEVVAVGNDITFFPYARSFFAIPYFPQLSGHYRIGGVSSAGQFALRSEECSPALAGGYVVPAVLGNDLLLYAVADSWDSPDPNYPIGYYQFDRVVQSGWAMIGNFRKQSSYLNPACWGKLRIKQEHPEGSFAAGWSKIIHTANGAFFHNPDTGAALVGSFDADGNFTQLHDLPSWLDPGYSLVVNVTD